MPSSIHRTLYFVRWQLYPVLLALPVHVAFILRGAHGARASVSARFTLARRCLGIHLRLRCGHNPAEALHVIEEIIELSPETPGVVVECGSFLGGSTSKLSLATALASRELIVCDSFEGLPDVDARDHTDLKPDFQKGEYAGRLPEVRRNVARFGNGDRVRFVQGWYDESLTQLQGVRIACGFWDVDLRESFLSCIRELWPGVNPGAKVFLHDIDRAPVVQVFTDEAWWTKEMGSPPPRLVGSYHGLGRLSPLIGYVAKA
jgi:O-methyltransferase